MFSIFSIDPRFILSLASGLGGLYFLCVCAEEIRSLRAYWHHRRLAEPTEHVRNPPEIRADLKPFCL